MDRVAREVGLERLFLVDADLLEGADWMVASRTGKPFSSQRSMFSSTTMASSTTMPMASTSPNSVRLFRREAHQGHDGEGADQRHRHVDHRQEQGLPVLQEQQDDDGHQDDGVAQGVEHLVDRLADERRGVVDDGVLEPRGEAASPAPRILALMPSAVSRAFDAGQQEDGQARRRPAVQPRRSVLALGPPARSG